MSVVLPSFDPTQATSGTFQTLMGDNTGTLIATNHSGVTLILTFADGSQKRLWAQSARRFDFDIPNPVIAWKQDVVLAVTGGYNHIDLEVYGTGEDIPEVYPISLTTAPTLPAALFLASGNGSFSAAGTLVPLGSVAQPNLGNWPFSNSEIDAGIATAGQIYLLIYGIQVGLVPHARDGATVEGGIYFLAMEIYDSSLVQVGGAFVFLAPLFAVSGATTPEATFALGTPTSVPITVTVGAGPPYKAVPSAEVLVPLGPSIPDIDVNWGYSFQATPPPALT